jgi:hypothetical protein
MEERRYERIEAKQAAIEEVLYEGWKPIRRSPPR